MPASLKEIPRNLFIDCYDLRRIVDANKKTAEIKHHSIYQDIIIKNVPLNFNIAIIINMVADYLAADVTILRKFLILPIPNADDKRLWNNFSENEESFIKHHYRFI